MTQTSLAATDSLAHHADVFRREPHESSRDVERLVAAGQHAAQPVERGVRVAAAVLVDMGCSNRTVGLRWLAAVFAAWLLLPVAAASGRLAVPAGGLAGLLRLLQCQLSLASLGSQGAGKPVHKKQLIALGENEASTAGLGGTRGRGPSG